MKLLKMVVPRVFFALISFIALHNLASACTNGNIRLYNGTASVPDNGMLQICKGGNWLAVCDYRWTQSHSIVACKQLGYNNPDPITDINNGPSGGAFGYLAKSSCSRSKSNVFSCLTTSGLSSSVCNRARDSLNLQCNFDTSGCKYQQIRLYNVTTNNTGDSGMLQICDSTGHWTAVCDFSWGCNEAIVACKQLGYNNPYPFYRFNGGPWTKFGFGPYSYCNTKYSSLFNCKSYSSSYKTNSYYCNPLRDTVLLNCSGFNNSCSVEYEVKLVGGNSRKEGRLEICYKGQWTSICSNSYVNPNFASTVCNQLGYVANSYATVITDGRYGTGTTKVYLSSQNCRKEYNNIQYCSLNIGNQCNSFGCRYSRIGLKCHESDNCNEGNVRLVNGTLAREGRLEVCADGVWGQICATNFRKSAAYVACKQLGYSDTNGAIIDRSGKYGYGGQPIVYSNVECYGHEQDLSKCSKSVFPNFFCSSRYIVGLLCYDGCKEGDVRLTGDAHMFQGTVEICLDNVWCLVAEHGWDDNDARVVCRQIERYNPSAGMAILNSTYGHPKRAIRYSNVNCRGQEEELSDCSHHTLELYVGRTYQSKVAGVDCGVIVSETLTSTLVSSIMTSTSVSTMTSKPTIIVTSPVTIQQTSKISGSLFISGLLFLIIAICIMTIGIIIMICIIARMRKLSISKAGRNSDIPQKMSSLEQSNPLSVQSDYDGKEFKSDKDDELLL